MSRVPDGPGGGGGLRVASPPAERPLLVFDGDCGFCRRWVARWRAMTGDRIDYAPWQEAADRFPEIPAEAFRRGVKLIEPGGGAVSTDARAVFRTLALAGRKRWLWGAYQSLPGFAPAAEATYRLVSGHRALFDLLDRWLFGGDPRPPSFHLTRTHFLRLLGVIYLIAFGSLWLEIGGLIGSRGILPIGEYLETARQSHALSFWDFPTLCWLNPSDSFLYVQCAAGVALAALLVLGVAPVPALAGLWVLYLSLSTACRTFLALQWDVLLLEAGFLAIFFAPLRPFWLPRPRPDAQPSRVVLWLFRWLVFRVMFLSGVVKLASGDPAWRLGTAMRYHYETQPLPAWTSWYAAKLPDAFQRLSVTGVFVIELFLPLLIFAPRRLRLVGFWGIVFLQLLILVTGSYGFFNLLTLVLCLLLLDDRDWVIRMLPFPDGLPLRRRARDLARVRRGTESPVAVPAAAKGLGWPVWVTLPLAAVLLVLTTMAGLARSGVAVDWPGPLVGMFLAAEPFRSANSYGLFAVMTTTRPEIIVEGSDDGVAWRAYEFKWKPGDVRRRPRFATPLMPRLDWQMWFAALEPRMSEEWLVPFFRRLLEGSPDVTALLATNPFPARPPRYLRATLYDYHFTSFAQRRAGAGWWRRERMQELLPPASLGRKDES